MCVGKYEPPTERDENLILFVFSFFQRRMQRLKYFVPMLTILLFQFLCEMFFVLFQAAEIGTAFYYFSFFFSFEKLNACE